VSSPPEPDVGRLCEWLEGPAGWPARGLRLELLTGGRSCLTYLLTDREGRRLVLRRPPAGKLVAGAHDVLREARILSALASTGVPVPRVLGSAADAHICGAPFYVMEFVAGPVLHEAPDVATFLGGGGDGSMVWDCMVDVLAVLHAVDLADSGLAGLSKPSGYLDRQLRRWWSQWDPERDVEVPGMSELYAWLSAHRPAETRPTVVHGDFRLGNIVHSASGAVRAVLDWELCTLGQPQSDLAYMLRYRQLGAGAALGGRTAEQIAARYSRISGQSLDDLPYWMAFNAWRSALIAEGVRRRALQAPARDMRLVRETAQKVVDAVESGLGYASGALRGFPPRPVPGLYHDWLGSRTTPRPVADRSPCWLRACWSIVTVGWPWSSTPFPVTVPVIRSQSPTTLWRRI
jgi:aminoglycoside phosphotransferase (APT) family kinase protein